MSNGTGFDRDPEALAWARSKVDVFLTRLVSFEDQAAAEDDLTTVHACRVSRRIAELHFLGDGDRQVGAFDERLPGLADGGPTPGEETTT
jgi:hypothetical protein